MPTIASIQLPIPTSWDEFEELLWDLYRREWADPDAVRHGRSGQSQAGVDIYGRRQGRGPFLGVQCKLHGLGKSLTLTEVQAEVIKAEGFEPPLASLTIATSAPRDIALQKDVRKLTLSREAAGKFTVTVLFWEDIQSRMSLDLSIARRFYPQFFQSGADSGSLNPHLPTELEQGAFSPKFEGSELRVFVSSRMNGTMTGERLAIRDAVEATGIARAWLWERDGTARSGTYLDACLQSVRDSDGLVMVIGDEVSSSLRLEYEEALRNSCPCYVFVKENGTRNKIAESFVTRIRLSHVPKNYRNVSELQTHVLQSLRYETTAAWRDRRQLRRAGSALNPHGIVLEGRR